MQIITFDLVICMIFRRTDRMFVVPLLFGIVSRNYGGPQGQYRNIFSVQKYIFSTEIYFQYRNIFSVQKYNFITELNIFSVQKYIFSTEIYFQYRNIFSVQKYIFSTEIYFQYRNIFSVLVACVSNMASWSCSRCDCEVNDHFVFCPSCGNKITDKEENSIKYYFSRGYEYKSIFSLLFKHHSIQSNVRTYSEISFT